MKALVTLGLALSTVACSFAPTAPQPTTVPEAREIPARLTLAQANDVTIYAISLVGTPYRYGGNTPDTGFDCSGLIKHVYQARASVAAPRTVAALVDWGQPVPANALRTGDLVVFTQKEVATHAGIYVGEGRFVHAPSTGGDVRLDPLTSKYWARQQVSFRRP
jgi:cell wall-associated NlpC family hydrolase